MIGVIDTRASDRELGFPTRERRGVDKARSFDVGNERFCGRETVSRMQSSLTFLE
jgi:hypothetical protein